VLILSQLNPVSTALPTSWRAILILPSHLRLGLPNDLFPSGYPTNTVHTSLLPHTVTTLCNTRMLQTLLSLATSHITKFALLLILTKQFSPHPQPTRPQQSFDCNTIFAPLLYRLCIPTWIGNTAVITMEHAQNGRHIVVTILVYFNARSTRTTTRFGYYIWPSPGISYKNNKEKTVIYNGRKTSQ
jgi:hypothetical protein